VRVPKELLDDVRDPGPEVSLGGVAWPWTQRTTRRLNRSLGEVAGIGTGVAVALVAVWLAAGSGTASPVTQAPSARGAADVGGGGTSAKQPAAAGQPTQREAVASPGRGAPPGRGTQAPAASGTASGAGSSPAANASPTPTPTRTPTATPATEPSTPSSAGSGVAPQAVGVSPSPSPSARTSAQPAVTGRPGPPLPGPPAPGWLVAFLQSLR
jgi:hypothetical protein